jgi:hypothetical protein
LRATARTDELAALPTGVVNREVHSSERYRTKSLPVSGPSLSALPAASLYQASPATLANHRTFWLPSVLITSHPKAWVTYGAPEHPARRRPSPGSNGRSLASLDLIHQATESARLCNQVAARRQVDDGETIGPGPAKIWHP